MGVLRPILKVEEKREESKALFWGEDFPFIAQILKKKLKERACQVYTKIKKGPFDYILIFGSGREIAKLRGSLKEKGKVLLIVSEKQEAGGKKEKLAIFSLTASKALTSEALAKQILRQLFASPTPPFLLKKKRPQISQKKSFPKFSFKFPPKISKKLLLLGFLIITIISPFIVLAISLFLGVRNLEKLKNPGIALSQREEALYRGQREIEFAKKIFFFLEPATSLFFPQKTSLFEEGILILENLTLAAREGIFLEKLIKVESKNLLGNGSAFWEERLQQIEERLDLIDNYLSRAELSLKNLKSGKDSFLFRKYRPFLEKISSGGKMINEAKAILPILPEILAINNGERRYLLLLQNNFELRPSGGFIGSYAILTFQNGRLKELKVEDVYTSDGQLKGHVEPPAPLAKYLNQPNWFLRDSNWNPDFVFSASKASWFFQKETGENVDGVFALDLYFLQNLLQALGGVYVPDYQATITASNFFLKLQSETQAGFFPGSSKKKNLLSSLSSALIIELSQRKNLPYFALLQTLRRSLKEKHLLLFFKNQKTQRVIERLGFGGRVLNVNCQASNVKCVNDYLMLVEANLGMNKVNYYLQREVMSTLSLEGNFLKKRISIYYKNNSPEGENLFSGSYKNYLRVLLSPKVSLLSIKINGQKLDLEKEVDFEDFPGKTIIGFLVSVPSQKQIRVIIDYRLPQILTKNFTYQFLMQKQPGIDSFPFIFKIANLGSLRIKKSNLSSLPYLTDLATDRFLTIDFEKIRE